MKYDPPEVLIGWFVSMAGALALAALSAIEWRRKRSARITKRQKG
jgi:Tfp pilus assembly protein PilV